MKKNLLTIAFALLISMISTAKNDISSQLQNADLNALTGWSYGDDGFNYTAHKTDGATNVIEFYHTWSDKPGTAIGTTRNFHFTQKVTLPAGYYRLAVNAFYREGNGTDAPTTKAYIFAGEKQQYINAITPAQLTELGKKTGSNDLYKAAQAFKDGEYLNEFDFHLDSQQEIEIGFRGYIDTYCSWCILGPVTLYEYTAEDYEGDYAAKVAEAKKLYDSPMNATVLSELKATSTDEPSWTTAEEYVNGIQTLTEKINAANASILAYSSLKSALDNAVAKKDAFTGNPTYTDFDTNIAAIRAAYDNGSYTDAEVTEQIQAVNAEINKLGKSQTAVNTDVTLYILGEDVTSITGWSYAGEGEEASFHRNTWSTEDDPSGIKPPFLEYWVNSGSALKNATMTYAATGLVPNTFYKVSALVREYDEANTLGGIKGATLFAGANSVDACAGTSASYGTTKKLVYGTYSVSGKTDDEGNLNFGIKVENAGFNWIAWKDMSVVCMGGTATAEEVSNFNTALASVEAKMNKLGFEAGEYAPYNGIEVIKAYKEAKNINTAEAPSSDIVAMTAALNGAWTANTEEVNAICDGTLKDQPAFDETANVVISGWNTVSGNTRKIFKGDSKACLAGAEDATGLFVHPGTYQYGNTEGYTMPLKAGKWYVAKAKYCSWENESNNGITLTILKDGKVVATQQFAKNPANVNAADALKGVEKLFKAEEDGDYVFEVNPNGNTFMTDFYLVAAKAENIVLSENATYTPAEKLANVIIERSFVAGWNGLVLPFDMTLEEMQETFGVSVVEEFSGITSDANGTTLAFTAATKVKAGVPVMIKINTPKPSYFKNNVYLPGASLTPVIKEAGDVKFAFTGTYDNTTVSGPFTLINGNYIYNYPEGKSANAKTFRAYFQYMEGGVNAANVCSFHFDDGIITSVKGVAEKTEDAQGNMKDILGREVKTAVRGGIYIKDGKKFVK